MIPPNLEFEFRAVQIDDKSTGCFSAMRKSIRPEDFGAVIFNLRNFNWTYRGEGNANIAISLPDQRQLIRLPKFETTDSPEDEELWRRLSSNILFTSVIMKEILGPKFVSHSSLIYLSSTDINHLNSELDSQRPDIRKHKKLSFCGGLLCCDHAFIPQVMSGNNKNKSVCIELKLKQGIYPPTESELKFCTFCCKQELKLRDGSTTERSKYCPLDVFSGSEDRMIDAVSSLLQTPQNNLRVFYDGNFAYGDGYLAADLQLVLSQWMHYAAGSDLVKRLSCMLVQALTMKIVNEYPENDDSSSCWLNDGPPCHDSWNTLQYEPVKEEFPTTGQRPCNFERHDLPEGCILHRLAQAQSLNQYGVNIVYNMLMSDHNLSKTMDSKNSTEYVEQIVRKGRSSQMSPIESYLISASVRDCSVLVTFQELTDNDTESLLPMVEDKPSKTKYIFKISVVDLDPKPLICIKSHKTRNALIQDACREASL